MEQVLKNIHPHSRDDNIQFAEIGHKYTILTDPSSLYTSVTKWNHSHFPEFNSDAIISSMMKSKNWKEGHKYWNMTPEEIKKQWSDNSTNVSSLGTSLHYEIECFMNNSTIPKEYTHQELWNNYNYKEESKTKEIEWEYFLNFLQDTPELKPFRTEWTIYHEDLKLAGSIDMVYENPDGTLRIYDWKRSKDITKINGWNKFAKTKCISHLPDSNFWHYALQLNTYKYILETKYNKKVTELCLIKLHPDSEEKNYEILNVPLLEKEMEDLIKERLQKIK